MPYLLRAINRENWPEPVDNANVRDLDADALNDLKTQDNTLSTWFANSKDEVYAAMVAYLASMDKWAVMECVNFIALDVDDINAANVSVEKTSNFTYITSYQEKHRDLKELNYSSIEQIADIFIKSINKGNDYIISQEEIKELFKEEIIAGRLSSNCIDKSKHKKLQRFLTDIETEIKEQT